jgi:hypothetical protein
MPRRRFLAVFCSVACLALAPGPIWAGMGLSPFQRLSEAARLGVVGQLRLEAISFFTVLFLVLAAALMRVWNAFRRDFPVLPRLTYGKALGLLLLWGLAMSLVLSMITGARELMTPGVWERAGALYRISGDRPQSEAEQLLQIREGNLHRLGRSLTGYAMQHDGRYPAHEHGPEISEDLWRSLAYTGDRYVYLTGRTQPKAGEAPALLAYEPEVYGEQRFALFTDGAVRRLTHTQLGEDYLAEMKAKFPDLYRFGP